MPELLEKLKSLIEPMDLPKGRSYDNKPDLRWLARNMPIRNADHPNFEEARALLLQILRSITCPTR